MPVMITNGNNVHSPDYHAEVTAGKIISAAEAAVVSISPQSQHAATGREVRKKIEAALLVHHQAVHDHEQGELQAKGLAHCDCDLDSHQHVDDEMLNAILSAAEGTPLHAYFMLPEVRDGIVKEVHHETRSQMNVHRSVAREADRVARRPRAVT